MPTLGMRWLRGQSAALLLLTLTYLVFYRALLADPADYMAGFWGLTGFALAAYFSLGAATRHAMGQRPTGPRAYGLDSSRWGWGPALRWWGLSFFALVFLPAGIGLLTTPFFGEGEVEAANATSLLFASLGLLMGLLIFMRFVPFFLRRAMGQRDLGIGEAWQLTSWQRALLNLVELLALLLPALLAFRLTGLLPLTLLLGWLAFAVWSHRRALALERARPRPLAVKICGLKDMENLEVALESGADLVGFNFVEASPRYLSPAEAVPLAHAAEGRALRVGLTLSHDADTLRNLLNQVPLDLLQIHADLSAEALTELSQTLGIPLLPVVSVAQPEDVDKARAFKGRAPLVLFDKAPPPDATIPGGNASAFDPAWLSKYAGLPAMLAGGLRPETAREAAQRSGAQALDVSSGVESSRGLKDPNLIRAFIYAAKGLKEKA